MKRGRRTKALTAILLHMKLVGKRESGIAYIVEYALQCRNNSTEFKHSLTTVKSHSRTYPETIPPFLAKDL